ncbi:polysaccharide deacetylase family protein [Heyndrickxia oleronia]|uniref:Chitooligosaccharide deacetylase n=1 Tax=Heyndrickxia oleronia TaxID=38875 RepID=A0A8E2LFL8_9BACI|nr:polysaccharide deacetylase family protein [Heyndrickxia oleronia]MCM3456705.1 polysaccharide deacetylase family protein [Heyndrickxia oleronia]MEC1375444.1 polysaccharide deacetylase family protein [Heyndrickxia oleronia]OOP69022.1 chitooligosaccharide deacetylase [Heyndrickxia oleronia]QQZ05136.1 polysaccharide deacetylase family protein [Heyndrickxia oleronia]
MRCLLFILCLTLISLQSHFEVLADSKGRFDFEKTGRVFWEVHSKEKLVALTFDDGPHPLYTPQILDILAKYDARATFFVIGKNAEKYPDIIRKQVDAGHEIANHTYQHDYDIHVSATKLEQEIKKTSNIIYSITGYTPSLFRPVGGYYNDTIVKTALKNDNYVIMWGWHQDTKDWSQPGTKKIIHNVISDTKPGDIILLHDSGGNRTQTVEALDKILAVFKKEGYECVTVSELLYRTQPTLPVSLRIFLHF